jgi:hypothetical protein
MELPIPNFQLPTSKSNHEAREGSTIAKPLPFFVGFDLFVPFVFGSWK